MKSIKRGTVCELVVQEAQADHFGVSLRMCNGQAVVDFILDPRIGRERIERKIGEEILALLERHSNAEPYT